MRRKAAGKRVLALAAAAVLLGVCWQGKKTFSFKAVILEKEKDWILVEPLEGEALSSADKISVGLIGLQEEQVSENLESGMTVRIAYDGLIEETYPAKLGEVYGVYAEGAPEH